LRITTRTRCASRIWVQADHREQFDLGNLAVVSLEDDLPKIIEGRLAAIDLNRVRRWFALNQDAILDHWAERIRRLRAVAPPEATETNRTADALKAAKAAVDA
jgi:hypothetical protein